MIEKKSENFIFIYDISSVSCASAKFSINSIKSSHAAIKISINATAAEFICKNIFPTPVQVKKNYKK